MIKKVWLTCLLGCIVQVSAAGPAVIASVSAQNNVYVSGIGAQLIPVRESGSESIVSGDAVTTKGMESWAAVRFGQAGLVEVGPDSTVQFDRVDGVLHATISDGGLRYSIKSGEALVIGTVGDEISSTAVVKVASALGAEGAVVIDDGRLLVKNDRGEMSVVDGIGQATAVPTGQLLAFQAWPVGSSAPGFQVGSTGGTSTFTPTTTSCAGKSLSAVEREACKKAGFKSGASTGLSSGAKAGIILGSGAVVIAFGIRELSKDDGPPGSPR